MTGKHFRMMEGRREECVHVFVLASVLSLITFVAAVHAHLASIWTHIALHALHSRLAGAQARHLLAVVPDRARGVAVARCRGKVEEETTQNRRRRINERKVSRERESGLNSLAHVANVVCLRATLAPDRAMSAILLSRVADGSSCLRGH